MKYGTGRLNSAGKIKGTTESGKDGYSADARQRNASGNFNLRTYSMHKAQSGRDYAIENA